MLKRFILSVRKKGIVILPKELRAAANIDEGSKVVAEIRDDGLLLKPLRPLVVRVDPKVVEETLLEEGEIEEEKIRGILGTLRGRH
jgi:AbrB family looped-hinge helix DNA binding protein